VAAGDPRAFLRGLFDVAANAAAPSDCLPPFLPLVPTGRTIVVGAGKAAAAMAQAVERHWPAAIEGFVVTRYGYGLSCERIEVVEAAHPVPDVAGVEAAQRALRLVSNLRADDLVLALISGGGSALLAAPAPGITLGDKQAVTRALLKCGASIHEINTVRKHLSAIKGGRLAAAAAPARVVTLAISDVPGDDPADIASGPTVADGSTRADALAVLDRYGIEAPDEVRRLLASSASETPKNLPVGDVRVIASARSALEAVAMTARAAGTMPLILGDAIEGEARDVARAMTATALFCIDEAPCVLLSGGETTVTVRGTGRGGRNAEFLLALALALDGHARVHAIACDTDGIDGTEDNAGAIITPDTLVRAAAAGLDPRAFLADNNAYGFFSALGDLVVTGPTRTNVNDFRAILISPP
jgi:glycerate 2-kinase